MPRAFSARRGKKSVMSHSELFQKFTKPGVQGSPCRGLGCPQILLVLLSPAASKREKQVFSAATTEHNGVGEDEQGKDEDTERTFLALRERGRGYAVSRTT